MRLPTYAPPAARLDSGRCPAAPHLRASGSGPLTALLLELPFFRRLFATGVESVGAFELALSDAPDAISHEGICACFGRIMATSGG